MKIDEMDSFYETIGQELKRGEKRPGLMARAIAEADGNPAKAKSLYIKYRLAELLEERQRIPKAQKGRSDEIKAEREKKNNGEVKAMSSRVTRLADSIRAERVVHKEAKPKTEDVRKRTIEQVNIPPYVFCSHCGKRVQVDDKIHSCPHCGNSIADKRTPFAQNENLGRKKSTKNWDRRSFRFAVRFAFLFGGVFIFNLLTAVIPGVRIFAQWGILFQFPLWIFLFMLPSRIWTGSWTKVDETPYRGFHTL